MAITAAAERSLKAGSLRRRLAAVLSADAVGYSRLTAQDEVATYALLRTQIGVLSRAVARHDGRVVDAVGDNLLAEFVSARDAVDCAIEAQRDLEAENALLPGERRLRFRIGIHVGDILAERKRVAGAGVNVAARLEGLAPPGGICLSSTAYHHVVDHVAFPIEDCGERTVKNLPRAIRVYLIRLDGADAGVPADFLRIDAGAALPVAGFGGRPAIAVLPFADAGEGPDGRWFAEAITEELTTRLSLFRWFPVMAASSVRSYAATCVDPMRVSRELGARYIVEGSVRRAPTALRITARLTDATDGSQVWADRYDRTLDALFALQDELASAILGSLMPAIERTERHRVLQRPPASLDAWECTQRGAWHLTQLTHAHAIEAEEWLQRATQLDPRASGAHSMLALGCAHRIAFGWTEDPAAILRLCIEASERGVALSEDDPIAHLARGWADAFCRAWDRAVVSFERALEMNPSFAGAYHGLGFALSMLGRPSEAIQLLERAVRLSPLDPFIHLYLGHLGQCHFQQGSYEEAVRFVTRCLHLRPNPGFFHLLASTYGFLGRGEDACAVIQECTRRHPEFSFETLQLFLPPILVEQQREGLRRGGIRAEPVFRE
jgi:adenylate cyclase